MLADVLASVKKSSLGILVILIAVALLAATQPPPRTHTCSNPAAPTARAVASVFTSCAFVHNIMRFWYFRDAASCITKRICAGSVYSPVGQKDYGVRCMNERVTEFDTRVSCRTPGHDTWVRFRAVDV